ncbi:hypothetical protein M9Y10_022523 [Tritrichomonas musculus]|uniref:Uncharacterized protein n=1 Tax=Tritrichomonas musculus TaxID=1915356 RepID=A0ABR2KTF4_9EUKA
MKSSVLKEVINEVIKRDIPSKEEISQMSRSEKEELEKKQQQIIELFRERIAQQLNMYQNKMNRLMNKILEMEQSESNNRSLANNKLSHQKHKASSKLHHVGKASESQQNNKICEIQIELKKIQKLSTYKRRPAWR